MASLPPPGPPGRELIVPRRPPQPLVYEAPFERVPPDPGIDEHGGLLQTWKILTRHKLAIALLGMAGAFCGVLFTTLQTPMYRAHTSMEIQGLNDTFLNIRDLSAISLSTDVQTQTRIIRGRVLRQKALERARRELAKQAARPVEPAGTWRTLFGVRRPVSREQAVSMAAQTMDVLSSRENRIVDILCDSPHPEASAAFVNALANEYLEQSIESRWETGQHTSEWLSRTFDDVRTKLEKSEQALQDYAQASRLTFTSDKDSAAEESLKQLQAELSRARSDRLARHARYAVAQTSAPDSLVEVGTSSSLNQYQQQLSELRKQRAVLTGTFTDVYPRVQRLDAQIAEIEAALKRDRVNVVDRIRTEYESAVEREKMLQQAYDDQVAVVADQAQRLTRYGMLKREVDSARRLYDTILQKVKEAGIAAAMQANNIRIIDAALPPSGPFTPSLPRNGVLGATAGLFVGMLLVLVREFADSSIRRPGHARVLLQVPELGVIPSLEAERRAAVYGSRIPRFWPRNGTARTRVELATWERKPSLIAESYRAALASLLLSSPDRQGPRVIVVTSPSPADGKTSVISNLGIALAEINSRVLLIDGDLHSPMLHRIFGLPNTWGLTDLLTEKQIIADSPIEALSRKTEVPGLYLLPAGPGTLSISNLLYSARMRDLVSRLRKDFDAVLIDTPPMLHLSDARVLSRLSDGAVLVVRAGRTHRDTAVSAVQRLQEDGTPVLGTILNHWDPKRMGGAPYASSYPQFYAHRAGGA